MDQQTAGNADTIENIGADQLMNSWPGHAECSRRLGGRQPLVERLDDHRLNYNAA